MLGRQVLIYSFMQFTVDELTFSSFQHNLHGHTEHEDDKKSADSTDQQNDRAWI